MPATSPLLQSASMWDYLKALRRETLPAVITAFSFASTVLTFLPRLGASGGRIRLISIACLVVGFLWANARAFAKQSRQVRDLETALAKTQATPARRANLVIHEGARSKYIAIRKSDQERDAAAAIYIEFHMAVENKGDRHSSISRYDLSIPGAANYADLKPTTNPYSLIPGIHANYTPSQPYLTKDGYIGIEAEKMSPSGYLCFRVPALPPASAPLHCVLTIRDTEGNIASHDFILPQG